MHGLERVGGQNLRAFVVNSAPNEVFEKLNNGTELPGPNGDLTIQNLHINGFIGKGGNGGLIQSHQRLDSVPPAAGCAEAASPVFFGYVMWDRKIALVRRVL